jgi:trypsin-like peptidase/PEGA domain-containing protein
MASRLGLSMCAAVLLLACAARGYAEKLQFTSNPPGATVELDGVAIGTTPCEKDFPGGYFHRTKSSFGARLEHTLVARISLAGYATKELTLTEGPLNWISLNGHSHGEYWLFKTDHFHVEPAVVYLKALNKSGTGFFVTGTGVLVTNAHLARGEESLLTLLSDGQQVEAKVVYIDAQLDIALAKVESASAQIDFPHLALAGAGSVRQGESVLAIGNPGDDAFHRDKGDCQCRREISECRPGHLDSD